MMNYQICESPLGSILLVSDGRALKRLDFIDDPEQSGLTADDHQHIDCVIDGVIEETMLQLQEWFAGQREVFDLPVSPDGTGFQHTVWDQLLKIPFGETRTYGEVAQSIDKPTAARAVGAANGKNPIALIIPCHRVNGANGALTGYTFGIERKKQLLELESHAKSMQP